MQQPRFYLYGAQAMGSVSLPMSVKLAVKGLIQRATTMFPNWLWKLQVFRLYGRRYQQATRYRAAARHEFSFNIEECETRLLLAGNVQASFRGSTLTIKGDASANEIAFVPGATPNTVVITGLSGTQINGVSSFAIPANASKITMKLGDGNDVVRIDDVKLGSLNWDLGDGNDLLEVERLDEDEVGTELGTVKIKAGTGNDTLRFGLAGDEDNHVNFKGKTSINGGNGNDLLSTLVTNQFAAKPKVRAVEATEPDPVTSTGDLVASLSEVIAGQNEQVIFRVILHSPAAGTEVNLFAASNAGVPDADGFLMTLFDDGNPNHQDAVAGDGIFTNTSGVNLSVGDHFYAATVKDSLGTITDTLVTHITAVNPSTDGLIKSIVEESELLQEKFDAAIEGGQTVSLALNDIQTELQNSGNVVDNSIAITDTGIFWQTIEGGYHAILQFDRSGDTHSRPGNSSVDNDHFVTVSEVSAADTATRDTGFSGSAIILAPFFYDFEEEGTGDESDNINAILGNVGFDTTFAFNASETDTTVGINSFKNLGQYDVVSIASHGVDFPLLGEVILTGQAVSISDYMALLPDIVAGRVVAIAGYWAITPRFISYYSGQMDDTFVYVGACQSAHDGSMASAFLELGASAYVGYTEIVSTSFANDHGISLFNYLTAEEGNKVLSAPGLNVDIDPNSDHAQYVFFGDYEASLHVDDLLEETVMYLSYTWPAARGTLLTDTRFIGNSLVVPDDDFDRYVTYSSTPGQLVVIVDLYHSYTIGEWSSPFGIQMYAGWPDGGSGSVLITEAFYNTKTQEFSHVLQLTVDPADYPKSDPLLALVGQPGILGIDRKHVDPGKDIITPWFY